MNNPNKKIITRFAPSPTGFVHVGNIRTALYAWAFAKKNNGTFILRIEDTDKAREVEGSIEHVIASLKWIGIEWNEGPDIGGPNASYKQSERLESYIKYAKILIDKGLAYSDPYTEEEVEAFRNKADEEKRPFLYRDHRPENPPIWDGKKPLRFKVPNIKSYEWEDMVRGHLKAGPEALDDFILIKGDGYPTYNFAHIIDDFEMGVTHIMRGDEFISSTPKFLSLYEALEIERPEFVMLPPIMGQGGKKKLGKRDGAKDFLEYENEGYLPEAMMNFLAFIGWNPGGDKEIITPEQFVNIFDIKQIHISGGQFNEEKLDWINHEHLKLLSIDKQIEYISKYLPENIKNLPNFSTKIVENITPIILERIRNAKDLIEMVKNGDLAYYFSQPIYKKDSLFFKSSKIPQENKYEILSKYIIDAVSLFEDISNSDFNKENIKNKIWEYAEKVGRGDILWPMRFALSGQDKSPDPFILAEILGKDETINRLNNAIATLKI
ncbi:MAG: glutamate--tRNA ligase [Candidatus Nomurabacteria bacterium]|nr:glutamate--tRNA ligase [Candidatus Nomurabacteria bacterium]